MAKIYQMHCPQCGERFEKIKGIFVSECGKPMPPERAEEAPFRCPKCGRVFCTEDEDFNKYVESFMLAD